MPLPSATPAPRPGNQLLPPTCFSATTACRPTNAPHACRPAMTRAPRSPADRDSQLLLPPGAAWGPRSELCASLPASRPPLDACTPCISTLPTPKALEASTHSPEEVAPCLVSKTPCPGTAPGVSRPRPIRPWMSSRKQSKSGILQKTYQWRPLRSPIQIRNHGKGQVRPPLVRHFSQEKSRLLVETLNLV